MKAPALISLLSLALGLSGTQSFAQAPRTAVTTSPDGHNTVVTSKLGHSRIVLDGEWSGLLGAAELEFSDGTERVHFTVSNLLNPSAATFSVSYVKKGQAERTALLNVQDLAAKNYQALDDLQMGTAFLKDSADHAFAIPAHTTQEIILKGMALAVLDPIRPRERVYIWFNPAYATTYWPMVAESSTFDGWYTAAGSALPRWEVNP